MNYITLYNGVKMPAVGYGTYQIAPEDCERCVQAAWAAGYRAFDTAQSYGNEEALGHAFQKAGVPRGELFLTTKVRPHYYDNARDSVLESMEKLKMDYLDLVLLHQPFGDVYAAYRDLEALYEEGKVRAIGVSNFYADKLVDLAYFTKIRPMVDQVERHPLHQRADLLEWGRKLGIVISAWSPLGHGRGSLLEQEPLLRLADKYGKTPAQIILRWNLQQGVATIPKSCNPERIAQNMDIFDFTLVEEDMQVIAALETGNSVFYSHNDPNVIERYALGVLKSKGNQ